MISGFMTKNPARRLGCIDGEDSIRKHPFFKGNDKLFFRHFSFPSIATLIRIDMDWDALEQRKVRPPFKPRVVSLINRSLAILLSKLLIIFFRRVHVMLSILTRNLLARSRC